MPDVTSPRPADPVRTPLASVRAWCGRDLVAADPGDDRGRGPADDTGDETELTGLSLSSQRVLAGDLYAALPGARTHGAAHAHQAVAAGAVAVLTDPDGLPACRGLGVPVLVVPDPRALLGMLAARLYGDPARDLTLVAVTGTQGKTTTTRLLEAGLQAAGVPAAVVGTVGTRVAGEEVASALTTPEAPDLHALFAVMRERGVRVCAMEVSSHALVLGRVAGVRFDVAAFTNLGRDHLDFHADVEDYFSAKASLFSPGLARVGLSNLDDRFGRALLERAGIPMRTFATGDTRADWRAVEVRARATGSAFTVLGPEGVRVPAGVGLPGGFNVSNALCAIAAAAEAGCDPRALAEQIARGVGVPGRLERVEAGQDFTAVVDYAHKPDALEAVLSALRPLTSGRLIVVLGAGGDRDPGKRALMGEVCARLADVVVVTDDNPRTEDPARIREALVAGARGAGGTAEVLDVADRGEAIGEAVRRAAPGDTVLVAGKGHEAGQERQGTMAPFDDREVLRRELAR